MKIRFYLAMAATALAITNCSHEEEMPQVVSQPKSFTATIEGSSRSAVNESGAFSWTYGDKFSVYTGAGTFDVYANSETDVNTFTFQSEGNDAEAGTPKDYAIYPAGSHSISNGAVTVNLPASYTHGSTNAPMLASIAEGSTNLSFKHLGGLMCFHVEGVPADATSFVFTMTDTPITGNYTVTEGQINASTETVNNDNSVSITFEASNEARNMTFYVPLPVGTYGKYTVAIQGGSNSNLSHESTNVSNTIGRRTLLVMPTFKVENDELKKGAGSTIAVTEQEQEASISGNQSLTISTTGTSSDANATLKLNYTPQKGNATLSLSDGSDDNTAPTTSAATVEVTPTTTETAIETLNINTPTLTVKLGAGKYGTVEALTATETLIIGKNATIETLVLNGGSLQVDAAATIENIVVKNKASLITALSVCDKVKLGADIEGLTEILVISKDDFVLDGDNHSIKSSAGRVINVTGANGVTIKNLTIEGTGERGINIIQNSTDVTVENVTATVANYAVSIASSAANAVVNITQSTLTGLNVVNISAESSQITITDTNLTCNDQNDAENYAAIAFNKDAKNSTVTVSGGKIEVKGDSYGYSSVPEGASITFDSTTGTTTGSEDSFYIEYGNYQYSFNTLEDAIATVKDNETIVMSKNYTVSQTVTIEMEKNFTLDLNGKTLYIDAAEDATVCTDLKNNGTLVIKNGKIEAAEKENSRRCIYNYGTMTINGVEFTQQYSEKGAAINNEGTLIIENATVNAVYYSIWTSGKNAVTTVESGTFTTTNDVNNRNTWAYTVTALNGSQFIANGGSFTGNHGVISVTGGGKATLNKGTYHCTAEYTGNSDWTLYAEGSGSTITYNETECTVTNNNTAGISKTVDEGTITTSDNE